MSSKTQQQSSKSPLDHGLEQKPSAVSESLQKRDPKLYKWLESARTLKLSPPKLLRCVFFFRELEENPKARTAAFEPKSKGTANQHQSATLRRYVVTWCLEIDTRPTSVYFPARICGETKYGLGPGFEAGPEIRKNREWKCTFSKLQAHPPSSSRTASHGNDLTDQPTLTHAKLIVNHVCQVDAHVLMAGPISPISDIKIIRPAPLQRILQIQSRWSAGAMCLCVCFKYTQIS